MSGKNFTRLKKLYWKMKNSFIHFPVCLFRSQGSEKQFIKHQSLVMKYGKKLLGKLQAIEEELVFESELYVINEYDLKIVEEYLEQITYSLSLFLKR